MLKEFLIIQQEIDTQNQKAKEQMTEMAKKLDVHMRTHAILHQEY